MLDVEFYNCIEIRMGSAFRGCDLKLAGTWVPELPRDIAWQDVTAQSPDGRFVGLVFWDTPQNRPGFRILTIDCVAHQVSTSARVEGCCQSISWRDGKFIADIWHA